MLLRTILAASLAIGICGALEIVILHTNDMHARLEPISASGSTCISGKTCYGGFARIKSFADRIRREERNVLFLNAGDNFQGTPYYTMFKWKVMAPLVDALKMDAMSLGNHEFDDGISGLLPYLRNTTTTTVCCNIDDSEEPGLSDRTNLQPWRLFNVENVTVAVIGYLTPDTKDLAKVGRIKIRDEVQALQRAASEVRGEGADIVIALGHSGWETDLRIARNVDGVDLVIGGHTNTFLYTGAPPDREIPVSDYPHIVTSKSRRKVPVVQAFAYTKYVGLLRLRFNGPPYQLIRATGNPVLMNEDIPEDYHVSQMIEVWKAKLTEMVKTKIGETLVDLDGDCRMRECNLGNLVADSFVRYNAKRFNNRRNGWTDAAVAFVNGGSIRTSILYNETDGIIRQNEGLTTLPFSNNLVKIRMNGSQLKSVLEHAVDKYDIKGLVQQGAFLQVSGLKIKYDIRRPVNDRVVRVQIKCSSCEMPEYHDLRLDESFHILTNQFVSDGGDGYTIFKGHTIQKESLGASDYEAFTEYMEQVSPVMPAVEGRLKLIRTDAEANAAALARPFYLLPLLPILYMCR